MYRVADQTVHYSITCLFNLLELDISHIYHLSFHLATQHLLLIGLHGNKVALIAKFSNRSNFHQYIENQLITLSGSHVMQNEL